MSGDEGRVRVMPRRWAGGVKSGQERAASVQAHRRSCKREWGQQAAALRAQPKKGTSVSRFGDAQHYGPGFKVDIRAGVKGVFQHS